MDTRQKIVPMENLAAQVSTGEWRIIAGLFDPLTAAQAIRLRALRRDGRKLAVVVLDVANSLLDGAARAVLVASLRDVNVVALAQSENWRAMLPNGDFEIVDDRRAEEDRSAEFIEFVLHRGKQ